MVFCEEDALLRQVNHVGIAGDFREILGTVRKKPTTFEEGKGALTWFSSHIVMNLSKALPGTYAAETAAAVETRNAPNRMVRGGGGRYREEQESKGKEICSGQKHIDEGEFCEGGQNGIKTSISFPIASVSASASGSGMYKQASMWPSAA
jgi:hypothetical protein